MTRRQFGPVGLAYAARCCTRTIAASKAATFTVLAYRVPISASFAVVAFGDIGVNLLCGT